MHVSRAERTVVVSMGSGVGVNGDCLGSTDERMFLPWAAVRDIVAQGRRPPPPHAAAATVAAAHSSNASATVQAAEAAAV